MSATRRVRILHLITKLPYGGAQDNTLLSIAGLDRAVYDVDIASSPGGDWDERARAVARQRLSLHQLQHQMAPARDLLAIAELVRLLRRERYDILHTHSSKAGLLGRIAGRVARVPLVIHTVHGFPFNDQTFSPRVRQLYLWLERLGARLSDQLIMVAELNRQEALARGVGRAEQMTVIHSGIDLTRFSALPDQAEARRRLNLPTDAFVAGSIVRIAACNGPELLAETALTLVKRHPQLHFLIAGDGKLFPQLQSQLADQPRIHLLGYRDDVPDILAALDAFVSTNLWGGLGRSITEALAAGLPTVAFPVNGVPELIQPGKTGLHAPVGDAAALADQVSWILAHPAAARQLGEKGRALVY
ncbi:MAG: glycosyltransferase family 4 protein, partial [Anaerolineales bacterium]|nr:glycosyltransferase family 4 protein [Anaerolineales bacterium]